MSHFDIQAARPIMNIEKAIDKPIYIKLKGRRAIKAILRSFDDHLNLFLEDAFELYNKYDQEQQKRVEIEKSLESIILRGDNVVFLTSAGVE